MSHIKGNFVKLLIILLLIILNRNDLTISEDKSNNGKLIIHEDEIGK